LKKDSCPGRQERQGKAKRSFLKERTKELLSLSAVCLTKEAQWCKYVVKKVFCFFFSKKKAFLSFLNSRSSAAWAPAHLGHGAYLAEPASPIDQNALPCKPARPVTA
jgi:hypothetical protein